MDAVPVIHYARASGGLRIAYHCLGAGPAVVLLFPYHVNDLVRNWSVPLHRQGMCHLANELLVLNLDLRGAGQSGPDPGDFSLSTMVADIHDVLVDAGLTRAALLAMGNAAPIAAEFAKQYPDLTSGLVLVEAGESETSLRLFMLQSTDGAVGADLRASAIGGLTDPANTAPLARVMRGAVSPQSMSRYLTLYEQASYRDPLAGVDAPALVVHARGDELIPLAVAEKIALSGARTNLMVLPGRSGLELWRDPCALDRVVAFVRGDWSGAPPEPAPARSGRAGGAAPAGRLTARELQVLNCVAAGMTNHQIAHELFISLNTVSHHMRSIFAKTSSTNRTAAAAYAHHHGLLR